MYIHIIGKGIYQMDRINIVTDSTKGTCELKMRCRNVPVHLVKRDMSKDIANEILKDIFAEMGKASSAGSDCVYFDEDGWFAERVKRTHLVDEARKEGVLL